MGGKAEDHLLASSRKRAHRVYDTQITFYTDITDENGLNGGGVLGFSQICAEKNADFAD